jgi:hypothetical protein
VFGRRSGFRRLNLLRNRDRLLTHEIAQGFLSSRLFLPEVKGLLSAEHFSVDGTMPKARASMKSFRAKDGSDEPPAPGRNGERGFRTRAAGSRAVFPISAMR